jgi:hypothetical protein
MLNLTIFNRGALGSLLVVGVNQGEEEEEDKEFTVDQVDRLRHVLITKRRSDYLEEMQEIILGDSIVDVDSLENIKIPQLDQSNNISTSIQTQLDKANAETNAGEKFDRLFALTLTLKHFDHLLQETSDVPLAQLSVDALGEAWKLLLPESDENLEIDSEITRKGITAFLGSFAESIRNKFTFRYAPPSSSGADGK